MKTKTNLKAGGSEHDVEYERHPDKRLARTGSSALGRVMRRWALGILPIAFFSASRTGWAQDSAATIPIPSTVLERCRAALALAEGMPPEERPTEILRGCKDLYAEKGCRDAVERAAEAEPSKRGSILLIGCRDAYCPSLSEPRPRICSQSIEKLGPKTSFEDWIEFQKAVFGRDLGTAYAKKLGNWKPGGPLEQAPPSTNTKNLLVVTVEVDGAHLAIEIGDQRWKLPRGPSDSDLSVVAHAVANLAGSAEKPRSVRVDAGKDVLLKELKAIMHLLSSSGFDRLETQILGKRESSTELGASATECKPKLLRPKVLWLVKPLLELRIKQHRDQFFEDGRWRGESSITPEVDRRFEALLKNRTPAGNEALAFLLTIYMGEHRGEEIVCEVINRGKRMLPLIRAVRECRPLTGIDPYPKILEGSGVLVEHAVKGLEAGESCRYEDD